MRRSVLACFPALLFAALPALSHHSFEAEYDSKKPIKLTGTVTKVEWLNPHIYYYVDVKDDAGKITNFAVEGGTPNQLYRQGWRKDSLRVGDVVTVQGFRAKDGANHVNGRMAILADGTRVFGGSSDDGGPAAESYQRSGDRKGER